jgi:hypothetical protein
LLCGLTVALAARQQIRGGAVAWRESYLPGLLLFLALVPLPLAIYLFASYPAWSTLYLLDPEDVGFLVVVMMLGAVLLLAVVGYQIGYILCRARRDALLMGLVAAFAVGLVLFLVLAGDRLTKLTLDGNWEQAPALSGTGLVTVFAFAVPVFLGGWIFLLVLFGMEGRKVRRARLGTISITVPPEPPGPTSPVPQAFASHERMVAAEARSDAAPSSGVAEAPDDAKAEADTGPDG